MLRIEVSSPLAENAQLREQLISEMVEVLDSGSYVLGSKVDQFERRFSDMLNGSFCTSCANGTDALELALKAGGIGNGAKVLVPSLTASPTVVAILNVGAVPVFGEVDRNGLLDLDILQHQKVDTFEAVVAVHLYGNRLDVRRLRRIVGVDMLVVEDCAQSSMLHRKCRAFSDFQCFSFYPTKTLGGIGDGGLVATHSSHLSESLRQLRQYGWDKKRSCIGPGVNSRLDEIQAAVLLVKLKYLHIWAEKKVGLSRIYYSNLSSRFGRVVQEGLNPDYHLFVIALPDGCNREDFCRFMANEGVGCGIHYPKLCSEMSFFKKLPRLTDLAFSKQFVKKLVSLPMHIGLSEEDVSNVALIANRYLNEN